MGIDQSHIEHLGTRFYRINRSFSANEAVPEGTGLGLAIVKQIANRHHGFLKIHSELNKGSTFSFYLPLSISNTPLNHQPV
jgi:signal transduction histidine kinase